MSKPPAMSVKDENSDPLFRILNEHLRSRWRVRQVFASLYENGFVFIKSDTPPILPTSPKTPPSNPRAPSKPKLPPKPKTTGLAEAAKQAVSVAKTPK